MYDLISYYILAFSQSEVRYDQVTVLISIEIKSLSLFDL